MPIERSANVFVEHFVCLTNVRRSRRRLARCGQNIFGVDIRFLRIGIYTILAVVIETIDQQGISIF